MAERIVASTVKRLGFKKGDMSIPLDAVRPPVNPRAVELRTLAREAVDLRYKNAGVSHQPDEMAEVARRRDEIIIGFIDFALRGESLDGFSASFERTDDRPEVSLTVTTHGEGILDRFEIPVNRPGRAPGLSEIVGRAIKDINARKGQAA